MYNVFKENLRKMEEVNAQNFTEWKEMRTKIPLAPLQKSSSHPAVGQPSNPRITLTLDKAVEHELKHGRKLDPNMNRKKLRRTISNRLSAQRSRVKRAQYINDMEKMVNDLEEMILVLTPQLESYKEKRKLLLVQNVSLQKLIEIRSNESKLCEMELEQKRVQVNNLKELEKTTMNKNINKDQFMTQPYPDLGFYQNGLQHLNKSGFIQENPVHAFVQSGLKMKPNFGFEKKQEEGDNIDQYLNYEALGVCPANV